MHKLLQFFTYLLLAFSILHAGDTTGDGSMESQAVENSKPKKAGILFRQNQEEDGGEEEDTYTEEEMDENAEDEQDSTEAYGGVFFEIGKKEAYLEMSLDWKEGLIELYLLAPDRDTPVYLEAESFEVHFYKVFAMEGKEVPIQKKPVKITFKALKEVWESETYINTSIFTAKERLFNGIDGFRAEIPEITIEDKKFKNIVLLHNLAVAP